MRVCRGGGCGGKDADTPQPASSFPDRDIRLRHQGAAAEAFARLLLFGAVGAAARGSERGAGRYRLWIYRGAVGCGEGGSAGEPDRGGEQYAAWGCRKGNSSLRGAATVL